VFVFLEHGTRSMATSPQDDSAEGTSKKDPDYARPEGLLSMCYRKLRIDQTCIHLRSFEGRRGGDLVGKSKYGRYISR